MTKISSRARYTFQLLSHADGGLLSRAPVCNFEFAFGVSYKVMLVLIRLTQARSQFMPLRLQYLSSSLRDITLWCLRCALPRSVRNQGLTSGSVITFTFITIGHVVRQLLSNDSFGPGQQCLPFASGLRHGVRLHYIVLFQISLVNLRELRLWAWLGGYMPVVKSKVHRKLVYRAHFHGG